ncbi:sulfurtransferase [Thermomonas brevis]
MDWTTLVQAESLADSLAAPGLRILDCRFSLADPAQGGRAYAQAHLPGALHAHLERDLSDMARPARDGRHPWPDADAFAATLGRWGIAPSTQVVAYDEADGAFAARAWCLLRMLGHRRVAVLDGGWARWTALGLPTSTGLPDITPTRYDADADPARFDHARLLDAAQAQAHLHDGGLLVDARGAARFRGDEEPIDPIAGHVPGAVNRPYTGNLDGGRFKSPAVLAQEFAALLGDHAPADVAVMCGSGVTACHHLLAMAHAGLHGGKLFTGSWSGWIADGRPVATGD